MISSNKEFHENKKKISLRIIHLQEEYKNIAIGRGIYLGNEKGVWKYSDVEAIKLITSEEPMKLLIGQDILKNECKEEIIIITRNEILFGIVSNKMFEIKLKQQALENYIGIATLHCRSSSMIALTNKVMTVLYQITNISSITENTNELIMTEYENGVIIHLYEMYNIIENKIYLIIQTPIGNKRIEI